MGRSSSGGELEKGLPPRSPKTNPGPLHGRECTSPPRVWLILGDKRGDNRQAEVLAEALGWDYTLKHIAMRAPYDVAKPLVRPSLHHVDMARSDDLEPPWPDLIVTIGRRPAMVALWVREQSGGQSKIVLVGKPSGRLQWYDLVVSSAEIVIAPYPQVARITLPLMRLDDASVAEAGELWEARLASLPRPLVAVLVGGPTLPFAYGRTMVERLLGACRHVIENQGGTAFVTTSRRTPSSVVEALRAELPDGAKLFAWTPDATDNPYHGLLALADSFVVTADSISMAVEVVQLQRPLAILPVPFGFLGAIDRPRRAFTGWLFAPERRGFADSLRQACAKALYCLRIVNQTRDFPAFHRMLFQRELAVPMGEKDASSPAPLPDELPAVIDRIKALVTNPVDNRKAARCADASRPR